MGILDLLIEEINQDRPEEEQFERLHSDQYKIVDTENGRFRIKVGKEKKHERILDGIGNI